MSSSSYSYIRLSNTETQLLPALEELYRAFALHEDHTNPITQFMDAITDRLDDDQMFVLLAQVDGEAVGYILAYDVIEHPFIPTWERAGYITQLFIRAEFQRRGIGQALVNETIAWFTQRGVEQIMLNVDVDNETGTQFWQKLGFTPYLVRMKRTAS